MLCCWRGTQRFHTIHCVIYTGDKESKEAILKKTRVHLSLDGNPRKSSILTFMIPSVSRSSIFLLGRGSKPPSACLCNR